MSSFTVLAIVAAVAGVAMAAQAQLMGHLDRSVGTIESVFLTYGSGAVVIGLVIVGCIGYATPRLGGMAAILIGVWLMVRQ